MYSMCLRQLGLQTARSPPSWLISLMFSSSGSLSSEIESRDRASSFSRQAPALLSADVRHVALLGSLGGMRRFVRSGGDYNPADELGTSLQDYYQKFSSQT